MIETDIKIKEDDSRALIKLLDAIKKKSAQEIRSIEFQGEKFLYPPQSRDPHYKLKRLDRNRLEICEILLMEKDIEIPDSLDGRKIAGIGKNACRNNKKLVSLTIPDSLQYIEEGAFENCVNLRNISLGKNIQIIGARDKIYQDGYKDSSGLTLGAFENCAIENIELPETLENLGENTFRGCEKLQSVNIPKKVKKIGKYCFYGCSNLERVSFSEGLTEIENGAFYECKALRSVYMPKELKKICDFAFQRCTNLTNVKLNFGLKTLGLSVFRECEKLREIHLPETLIHIRTGTFDIVKKHIPKIKCKKNSYAWEYATTNGFETETDILDL